MGGLAGQCRQLVIAQRIEVAQAALFKGVEKLLIPSRIERVQTVLVFNEIPSCLDDPLLARLSLISRQLATAAHQAISHARIDLGQFRHRRLMGQPSGSQEQHTLVQRLRPLANCFTEQTGTLEAGQRHGDRVDEHRNHRAALASRPATIPAVGRTRGRPACDKTQRRRHRHPARLGAGFGQRFGHVQGTGGGVEIADGVGRHADAEGRHHVVEKTVVVVGAEQHDQLRVEAGDALTGIG